MTISDNGVGFAPERVLGAKRAFGVMTMRERVELLGGEFCIDSLARNPRARGTRSRCSAVFAIQGPVARLPGARPPKGDAKNPDSGLRRPHALSRRDKSHPRCRKPHSRSSARRRTASRRSRGLTAWIPTSSSWTSRCPNSAASRLHGAYAAKANTCGSLILTMYDEEELVSRCLEAGASGYVLKDAPPAQLIYAIQEIAKGGEYLSPGPLKHNREPLRASLQAETARAL